MSSNFSPTPAELTLVAQVFAKGDTQKLGVLTGEAAVRVFGGAKLQPVVLGEIWNIADEENQGWLSKKHTAMAIRLIGWAQKGEKMTAALLNKPGPLAVIEGINNVTQHNTGMSSPRSPPPQSFPPLSVQDKAKFQSMFLKAGAVNGLLSGDKARDLFLKSKLSNEHLMKIWNLADTQDRGVLDVADFAVGMYFIQGVMSGTISFVPSALPPSLYQQASGISNTPSVRSHTTGTSGSFSPVRGGFAPQMTGQSSMLQQHNTGTPFAAPALPARPSAFPQSNGHAAEWDVTSAEKSNSDRFFESLDTQKRGFIEGDVAVPFMLKSNLPGEVLAQIWDLADINNDGCLTKEGLAIALHLINKKLGGQDIPATLPSSLIPPSLRSSTITQSPFTPVTAHHAQAHPEADLFSFDAFDDPPPTVQTHSTGSAVLKPQMTGQAANVIGKPPVPPRSPVPTDPFASASRHLDFMGDDAQDGAASPQLHDQSAEIGNVRNQLQSTERSLASVKQERQTVEQNLTDQATQLSTLQTQLSSAKAAYETETSLLNTLKERRTTQLADIQKTKEELIRAESDLSAVRVEKSEIEGAFLRDKEEARDLHKRMVEAGQQGETLKHDVEKLKKEAKQQKGLLAIARKQLSTKEAERAKVQKEHEEALAEVTGLNEEKNAVDESLAALATTSPVPEVAAARVASPDSLMFAAAQPLPATPDPSQPARNNSNNPFERLAMGSGNSTPRSQSPFLGFQNSIISSPPLSINGTTPFDLPPQTIPEEPVAVGDVEKKDAALTEEPITDVFKPALSPTGLDGVFSPNTDHFLTPLSSTSPIEDDANSSLPDKFPALDALATPPAAVPKPAPAAASTEEVHPSTDLSHELKELEVVESDSSDDDSDDDQPLATLPAAKGVTAPLPNGKANEEHKEEPTTPPATLASAPAPASTISFDDIFGTPQSSLTKETGEKPSAPEPFQPSSEPFTEAEEPPHVAGVNEFDQTLDKSIISNSTAPTTFSFDDAFDDSFDFASAKVDAPATSATPTPAATEKKEPSQTSTFEDIFGTSSTTSATTAPTQTSGQGSAMTNGHTIDSSFDAVFAGFNSDATDLKLDGKLEESAAAPSTAPQPSAVTTPAPTTQPPPARNSNENSIPGAFPLKPSPVSSPTRSEAKSSLSKRGKSPPPRIASPKPRASSSSSKEPPPVKEPPPRHSKISLRLPFTKRKKQPQEPVPNPATQLLTPPAEEPGRIRTPANEDDVEPVKQLSAMGFSRTQAVEALEKFDYDVPRALNSLLKGPK